MSDLQYKCKTCGWIGYIDWMDSNEWYDEENGEYGWCSTICPGCNTWWSLDDYELYTGEDES